MKLYGVSASEREPVELEETGEAENMYVKKSGSGRREGANARVSENVGESIVPPEPSSICR